MTNSKTYRKTLHEKVKDYIPAEILRIRNKNLAWQYGYCKEYDMVVISKDGTVGEVVDVYGLKIALPKEPEKVRFEGMTSRSQKWKRYDVPRELMYFDRLNKNSDEDLTDLTINLYKTHKDFIDKEFKKIEFGDWLFIDGMPVYITGNFYYFLQYYYLIEDNKYPDFRMTQRDYFLWLEACIADERCLGNLLLKSRRSAFSTSAASLVLATQTRKFHGYTPIVAQTAEDSKKIFQNYIVKAFNKLPKHLQPLRRGEYSPKKELEFSAPQRKITTKNNIYNDFLGLETRIEKLPCTMNAFDGQRTNIALIDELGKYSFDVSLFWNQGHRDCFVVGSRVVGKAICGSTANPPAQGGKNYEDFFEKSDITNRNEIGQTQTGLYGIFIPADINYDGFFDEFGYPIYYDPETPVKNNQGKMVEIGAKRYLDIVEDGKKNNPKEYYPQKRNNPRTISDAFLDEENKSMFDTPGVVANISFLKSFEKTEIYSDTLVNFDLVWKDGLPDGEVKMVRKKQGKFSAVWLPAVELRNTWIMKDGKKYPKNGNLAVLGLDPYAADKVVYGSGSKQALLGLSTTTNPFIKDTFFLLYNTRSRTLEEATEDVIKCMVYFSLPILPEINKPRFVEEAYKRGYRGFILSNPLKTKNKLTDNERKFGGIHTIKEMYENYYYDLLETYINENINENPDAENLKVPFRELLEEWQVYTPEKKNRFDKTMASILCVAAASSRIFVKKEEDVQSKKNENIEIINFFKSGFSVL